MARRKNFQVSGDDTIVAIVTPPGQGGLSGIRIAGQDSLKIIQRHFRADKNRKVTFKPFLMRYGFFVDRDGERIDEVTAVCMPAGKSYTGLEQVEIFCHGGRQVVATIMDQILLSKVRIAEPGEFTRLAFLSGRIDLARAEAVAEIIAANSRHSYETAKEHLLGDYSEQIGAIREKLTDLLAETEAWLDFPEEEIEPDRLEKLVKATDELKAELKILAESYRGGRIINEGFKIALAGRPNAGKSSLFNQLLKQKRAIVAPMPGTTRDYLSEWIDLDGFAVNIIDTAGIRKGGGTVEKIGRQSARKIMAEADLIIWIFDTSLSNWTRRLAGDVKLLPHKRFLAVGNKVDLAELNREFKKSLKEQNALAISCLSGHGIKSLQNKISSLIDENMPDLTSGLIVTSKRHLQKLKLAVSHLKKARSGLKQGISLELVAFDLRMACSAIDEIIGRVYNEEILGKIFSKFCIGK